MKLELIRKYKNCKLSDRVYCIGKLYIDGEYFCDTIEDEDFNWDSSTPVSVISAVKSRYKSKTAIPHGTYPITLDVVSPKYKSNSFYRQYANGGRVPRIMNVHGFDGVLIHCGNTEKDSAGCVIIGKNTQVGKVLNSRETFQALYPKLQSAVSRREKITLTIS